MDGFFTDQPNIGVYQDALSDALTAPTSGADRRPG